MRWTKLFGAGAISVLGFVFCVARVECKPVIICLREILGGEHIGCGSFGLLLWKPRVSSQIHGLHQQNEWELCSGRSQNHPIPWKRFPYMCKTSSCRTHGRCNTRLNHARLLKIQAHCSKEHPCLSSGQPLSSTSKPTVLPAMVCQGQQKLQGQSMLSLHSICHHPLHGGT